MAVNTLKHIANDMAKEFICSSNKHYALNKILHNLNNFVFANTKLPLDYKAKSIIVKHIYDVVAGRKELLPSGNEHIVPRIEDITVFYERIHFISAQLKTNTLKKAISN